MQWLQKTSQMWEYLHPNTLQTIMSNALQAAQASSWGHGMSRGFAPREGRSFLDRPREPQLSASKDGTMDPEKTFCYCKDIGHDLDNCLHLQCKKDFQVHQQQGGQGSN